MEYQEERITGDKAEKYLNRNNGNRKMRDGIAEKYANDMREGRWTECAAPIVIYENGDIADGQHRLWAIVDSGKTQKFLVIRDFPREAGLNIDTGVPRSLVDNARISGLDNGLSNELISVARAIHYGERGGKTTQLSNSARLELIAQYREAADWAVAHGPRGKGLRNAVILAAVGRAYMHVDDREVLQRFCNVVSTGHSDGHHESAAVSLRNYLDRKSVV